MPIQDAFDFKAWINDHKDSLKPPVGNAQVFKGTKDFIIMVVGGPNSRKDYHYNESEEFYYQLEGNMVLKIIDEGVPRDIHINEGSIFMLPGKVPHSPQRGPNTVGLVVEKVRQGKEIDGFLWFCENCGQKLYEEYMELTDIVAQLPPVMNRFYENRDLCTCTNCGHVMEPPVKLS